MYLAGTYLYHSLAPTTTAGQGTFIFWTLIKVIHHTKNIINISNFINKMKSDMNRKYPGQGTEKHQEVSVSDCDSSCSTDSSSHRKKQHDVDDEDAGSTVPLCTFAATGTTPAFQSIYICHTCSQKNVCSVSLGDNEHENDLQHKDNLPDSTATTTDGKSLPLCICENCAHECHEAFGHNVEYYGSGPSYCDCSSFYSDVGVCHHESDKNFHNECCVLQDASIQVAEKLGISNTGLGVNYNLDKDALHHWQRQHQQQENEIYGDHFHKFPFLAQAYTVPLLSQPVYRIDGGENQIEKQRYYGSFVSDVLVEQALELICHSSDTHWLCISNDSISNETYQSNSNLCDLERIAYGIFQRHVRAFHLEDKLGPDGGAEWWVQVKKTSNSCGDLSEKEKNEAIDLHYDKDEELAETFDLGSFPTLSTVTYLSGSMLENEKGEKICAAPTVVFPHTYEMPGEGPIGREYDDTDGHSEVEEDDRHPDKHPFKQPHHDTTPQVLISHPRLGKHLVFDGRLLHGAPSNKLLRKLPEMIEDDGEHFSNGGVRVTFLVNIWLTRRPSKVNVLSNEIRKKIMTKNCVHSMPSSHNDLLNLDMIKLDIGHIDVQDGKGAMYQRVHLPFVSSGATWIDGNNEPGNDGDEEDDENVESGLVLSMVPPPVDYREDSVFVTYDKGDLEPCLEYTSTSHA